jgi:hypothetical protein
LETFSNKLSLTIQNVLLEKFTPFRTAINLSENQRLKLPNKTHKFPLTVWFALLVDAGETIDYSAFIDTTN